MHTLMGFAQDPRNNPRPMPWFPAKRKPKNVPAQQNVTMGTVSQADLGGRKLNPNAKPQPPKKPSEIVDRMR